MMINQPTQPTEPPYRTTFWRRFALAFFMLMAMVLGFPVAMALGDVELTPTKCIAAAIACALLAAGIVVAD